MTTAVLLDYYDDLMAIKGGEEKKKKNLVTKTSIKQRVQGSFLLCFASSVVKLHLRIKHTTVNQEVAPAGTEEPNKGSSSPSFVFSPQRKEARELRG